MIGACGRPSLRLQTATYLRCSSRIQLGPQASGLQATTRVVTCGTLVVSEV